MAIALHSETNLFARSDCFHRDQQLPCPGVEQKLHILNTEMLAYKPTWLFVGERFFQKLRSHLLSTIFKYLWNGFRGYASKDDLKRNARG